MFPILLSTPWFEVPTYGVLFAIAFLLGVEFGVYKGLKDGQDPRTGWNFVLVVVIFTFVGARGLYVFTEWDKFAGNPAAIVRIWEGGMVFYGGLIGAFSACAVYILYFGVEPLKWADYGMPSVALGQAIGRLGCLCYGCCYGSPTTMPWGIELPGVAGVIHPVQLYASASLFFLFGIQNWLYNRYRLSHPGCTMLAYAYYQAFHRFTLETFRSDPRGGTFHFGLTISQEIAVLLGIGAVVTHLYLAKVYWPRKRRAWGLDEKIAAGDTVAGAWGAADGDLLPGSADCFTLPGKGPLAGQAEDGGDAEAAPSEGGKKGRKKRKRK